MRRIPNFGWLIFVGSMLTVGVLRIVQGYQVSAAEGSQQLQTSVTISVVGAVVVIAALAFLNAGARARNAALREVYPDGVVLTVRATDELRTKLAILGREFESEPLSRFSSYSSLVVDRSEVGLWVGPANDLTQLCAIPCERVTRVDVGTGPDGETLCITVEMSPVPVSIDLVPVELGTLRAPRITGGDLAQVARRAHSIGQPRV